jgi:hypothetical protein
LIFSADHQQFLVVDDAVAASVSMYHLLMDDAFAVPIIMPSCRTQRLPLDVDDAFMTPVTMPSSSCGIAPQLVSNGTALPTTFTLRH